MATNLTAQQRFEMMSQRASHTTHNEYRMRVRKTSQQTLLYLSHIVAQKNERFYTTPDTAPAIDFDPYSTTSGHGWQSGYQNIIPIISGPGNISAAQSGNPDVIVSQLTGLGPAVDKFFTFELTSAQLACLVPKIIISKLDYKLYAKGPKKGQVNRQKKPRRRRIVFEKALTSDEVKQLSILNSGAKGGGNVGSSGIESFEWNLQGVNPAEVDSNIKARLQLYFNNVNAFQRVLDDIAANRPAANRRSTGSIIDLITFAPPTFTGKLKDLPCLEDYTPEFFEILIEVGWELASGFEGGELFTADQVQYIKNQHLSLYLTLTDHQFDFKEDGSATLEVNYRARSTMNARHFDIINPPLEVREAASAVKDLQEEIGEKEEDEEITAAEEDLLEDRQEELVKRLKENYKRITTALLDHVYEAEVPNTLLLNGMKDYRPGASGADTGTYSLTFDQLFKIITSTQGQTGREEQEGLARFYDDRIKPIKDAYREAANTVIVKRKYKKHIDVGDVVDVTLDPDKELKSGDQVRVGTPVGEEITTGFSMWDGHDPSAKSKINFLYLGDIIEVFLDTIPVTQMMNENKFAMVLTDFRYTNYLKLIMEVKGPSNTAPGEFTIAGISAPKIKCDQGLMPKKVRKNLFSTLNMANIPINLELFLDFFTEKVVASNRQNYYLEDFLNDLFNSFLRPLLGSSGVWGVPSNQPTMINLNVDTTNQCLLFKTGNKVGVVVEKDAITDVNNEYLLGGPAGREAAAAVNNYINGIDEYSGKTAVAAPAPAPGASPASTPPSAGPTSPIFPPRAKDEKNSATVKILGINLVMDNLEGAYDKNSDVGIKNFIIGLDRGILKSVSFERVDQPYLREARTAKAKNFGVGQLRELYNVNLTLYGNNLLKPGQIIYVEPNSLIFGRPTHQNSVSRVLGVGGYHLVVDVNNEISSEGWQTKVKALHMAMPSVKEP